MKCLYCAFMVIDKNPVCWIDKNHKPINVNKDHECKLYKIAPMDNQRYKQAILNETKPIARSI